MSDNLQITKMFELYKSRLNKVNLDGVDYYRVEGDLLLDEEELLLYASEQVSLANPETSLEEKQGLVGVVDDNGRHVRWAKGLDLSYAIDKDSFLTEANYETVVTSMLVATSGWESICGVKFNYLSYLDDGQMPAGDEAPLFMVRFINDPSGPIASAFFPQYPKHRRFVNIFPDFYTSSFSKDGVLRHELGHVLGFRHEHIRLDGVPGCGSENLDGTANLTEYDPKSVMHYLCGGVGSRELEFTKKDQEGATLIYGLPDHMVFYFSS